MSTSAQVRSSPSSALDSLFREPRNSVTAEEEQQARAEMLHDVRNVLATLQLYCDLLAEPEALAKGREDVASELRVMLAASSCLIAKLAAMKAQPSSTLDEAFAEPLWQKTPIEDIAAAVRELSGPLAALAGPKIDFEVECLHCPGRVHLDHEDLTRILINLTRNAAEAMPQGGRIRVTLQQGNGGNFLESASTSPQAPTAILCVQDSGPGVPKAMRRQVFDAGFSTKNGLSCGFQRGLGLSIVRQLVETAGGCVRIVTAPGFGTRLEVELPQIASTATNRRFPADFLKMEHVQC